MRRYKVALFAPDGEWVTDYRDCDSVEAAWKRVNDRGSGWYFYPYPVIIRDNGPLTLSRQRVVSAPELFEDMEGRTLRSFGAMLRSLTPAEHAAILS